MRQAIVTRYLGPTDRRGARVKATAQVGSVTIAWDDALNVNDNHYKAAKELADKFEWLSDNRCLVGGGMPDGTGKCYVIVVES